MQRILFIFVVALCFYQAKGQSDSQISKAYQIFETRGEVYFRFSYPLEGRKSPVLKQISIDKLENGMVYAYANRKEFETIMNQVNGLEMLTAPSLLTEPVMAKNLKEVQAWNVYPTYDHYVAMMDSFVNAHPTLCRKEVIGTTVNGRQLLVLKISDNVTQRESEPEFLYTSTMHGDELTGAILTLRLVDYLLTNYGTNPEVTALVDSTEIWINPLANPDGTYFLGNNTVSGAIRYNGNYVDLNRNFPDTQNGDHPDGNAWQPETMAWMDFLSQHTFVMSANFHGGAEVMNYPWDKFTQLHADDDWFQLVSREFVDTIHVFNSTGYMTDLENGITNGNAWYEIDGGRQDYETYFHHGREITIEISNDKNPPANQLPDFWNWNYRSLINYVKQVNYGIHGIVTDSVTGEPLRAYIEVLQHDIDSSQIYSDLPHGNYYRLIKEGTYNLRFSSPEYITKIISGVHVTDFETTYLDVQLVKAIQGVSSGSLNKVGVFPNPSDGHITITTGNLLSCRYEILSLEGNVIASGNSDKGEEFQVDITGFTSGVYLVKVLNKNGIAYSKVVKTNH